MDFNTGVEFVDNCLSENNYEYLGKGMNGVALMTLMGQKKVVIKFTNSTSEFKMARKLMSLQRSNKKYLDYSTEVISLYKLSKFKFKINGNSLSYKYLIITDYLICNDKLKKYFENYVFGTVMDYCFQNKMLISEFIQLKDIKTILKHLAKDSVNYRDLIQLIEILKLHKKLGSGDYHSGNLGYDENGVIKAFDFDEVQLKKL